jgi:hypothetical protein
MTVRPDMAFFLLGGSALAWAARVAEDIPSS